MRIPGVKTARLFSRWLQGRVLGGALILGYHRITNASHEDDISVAPARFREHLEVLQKYAHPMPLAKLVEHLENGTLPRRAVAVTFDDGYVDNLQVACPLLNQYQVPATIFISTGYLGEEFWWDELKRLVMSPPFLPESFQLAIQGEVVAWNPARLEDHQNRPGHETDRMKFVDLLYARLLPLEKGARQDVMEQLRQWAGNQAKSAGSMRALTSTELQTLASSPLIAIGSHTVTHPILSNLSDIQQREEIRQSKENLENLLGKSVPGIAYPNGKFTAQTQAIVQEAGYSFACGSQKELARVSRQRFSLPRLWPKNWNGEKFAQYIRLWLG